MEPVDRLLLCAIDAFEQCHETGPTVRELAADLGLPPDFGHEHLVERLQSEVKLDRISHYRGRFGLTNAGRLALDADQPPSSVASRPQSSLPTTE
jgi:hypothetical protein